MFDKVGGSADGLGAKLANVGKIAAKAVGVAAVGAVAGLGAAMVQGVKDAVAYQTLQKKTEAVIKSTGNAAGISVKGIQSLASELESLSGVDETLIINSENVFATFTNIRNVGKDKIFDQATKSALDMSVALGTDLQGASIQVGKALNDPVKGVTALQKVGVSFTADQKKMIKQLVDTGDTLGAQKIILKELNTEFGGAAQAAGSGFAGSLARLKDAFSDAFRDIGITFLPALTTLVEFLGKRLPPVLDGLKSVLGTISGSVQAFVKAFVDGNGDITSSGVNGTLEELGNKIRGVSDAVLPFLQKAGDYLRDNFVPILGSLAGAIAAVKLAGLATDVGEAVAAFALLSASEGGFGAALLALLGGPVTLIIAGIAAVAAGAIYAYTHFDAFRDVVDGVVDFLQDKVLPIIQIVADYLVDQLGNAVDWVKQIWPQVSEAIGHVMNVVEEIIRGVVSAVSALWRAWGDDLLGIVMTVWGSIKESIANTLELIRGVIQFVVALINGDWGKAWDGLKAILDSIWDQITSIVSGGIWIVAGLLGGLVSTLGQMWQPIYDGLTAPFRAAFNEIMRLWNDGPGRIAGAKNFLGGASQAVLGPLAGLIPGFANGGFVPGAIGAPMLAVVHGGEEVIANGGGGRGIHLHIDGNVYGVDDLDRRFAAFSDHLETLWDAS